VYGFEKQARVEKRFMGKLVRPAYSNSSWLKVTEAHWVGMPRGHSGVYVLYGVPEDLKTWGQEERLIHSDGSVTKRYGLTFSTLAFVEIKK
jgi:hypothetical protein